MNVKSLSVLAGGLAATPAYLVALSNLLALLIPKGRSVKSHLRAPGPFCAEVVVNLVASVAFVAAIGGAVLSSSLFDWSTANLAGSTFPGSFFTARFASALGGAVFGVALAVRLAVEFSAAKPANKDLSLAFSIARIRTVLSDFYPLAHRATGLFVKDFAAISTRLTWLLHLDTLRKETSRFDAFLRVSSAQKRNGMQVNCIFGSAKMPSIYALDRAKYSTNELVCKGTNP
jgi:hypothetical protein